MKSQKSTSNIGLFVSALLICACTNTPQQNDQQDNFNEPAPDYSSQSVNQHTDSTVESPKECMPNPDTTASAEPLKDSPATSPKTDVKKKTEENTPRKNVNIRKENTYDDAYDDGYQDGEAFAEEDHLSGNIDFQEDDDGDGDDYDEGFDEGYDDY